MKNEYGIKYQLSSKAAPDLERLSLKSGVLIFSKRFKSYFNHLYIITICDSKIYELRKTCKAMPKLLLQFLHLLTHPKYFFSRWPAKSTASLVSHVSGHYQKFDNEHLFQSDPASWVGVKRQCKKGVKSVISLLAVRCLINFECMSSEMCFRNSERDFGYGVW